MILAYSEVPKEEETQAPAIQPNKKMKQSSISQNKLPLKKAVMSNPYLSFDPYSILGDFAFFKSESSTLKAMFPRLNNLDFHLVPVDKHNPKEFDGRVF